MRYVLRHKSFRFFLALVVLYGVIFTTCGTLVAKEKLNWNNLLTVLEKPPESISKSELKRTKDSVFGMDSVVADDMESGIAFAASEHLPGVQVIKTGSGVGFIATGAGVYDRYSNINSTRLSQRQAYVVAFMNAKKELSVALKGLSVEGRETLASSVFQQDDSDVSSSSSKSRYTERAEEAVQAVLSGYTTYEVFDDEKNTVYVSLVTTPKTRSACLSVSGALVDAVSLSAGLKRVFREITAGVVPPVGGRVVNVPETGEVAVVSFGSAIIKETGDSAQNAQERLISQRRARARADSSMVAILRGDDYMWRYGFNSSLDKDSSRYKDYVEDDSTMASSTALKNQKKLFLSAFEASEESSSVVRGKLPEGTSSRSWYSKNGAWCYVADVYLTSSNVHAKKAASEMVKGKPYKPEPVKVKVSAQDKETFTETSSVKVNWQDGYINVVGEAVAPDGKAYTAQGKLLAKRGSMLDLQRNFLEFIKGVKLDSRTTMKDLMVENDIVNSSTKGIVKHIRIYKSSWDGEIYTLYGRVPVKEMKNLVKSMARYVK